MQALKHLSNELDGLLKTPVYHAYTYSYPHKTAYRPLPEKQSLLAAWEQEDLNNLFLYVHIPFCSMRCGFCNLFTMARPDASMADRYLDALARQISALSPILEQAGFARYAIGGGTPTYLDAQQLRRLFELTDFNGMRSNTPIGIECSPETVSKDKIDVLQGRGVSRISMGVQSFAEYEVKSLARPQQNQVVESAIDIIRGRSTADLNLDLIYGVAGQTPASWQYSLEQAVKFAPEEIYLYPLYVRDKTGLGKKQRDGLDILQIAEDEMQTLYTMGRDFLNAEGYEQISMRMFRKRGLQAVEAPHYSCQEDGMIGLGAGARSYTQHFHYSSEYAVGRKGVKAIIEDYVDKPGEAFAWADYGFQLDQSERKRRYLIQSLLIAEGLDIDGYQEKFKADCLHEFPQLQALLDAGLAVYRNNRIILSDVGLARADSIGPWFMSDKVKAMMGEYNLS